MTQLFWLRTDLRVADNTALSQAMSNGPTVAVYLLTPQQWLEHDDAPCKVDFWLRNLACLREQLGKLNVPLLIRACTDWQQVPATLLQLCQQINAGAVHCNEEYGVHETRRDHDCAGQLERQGIAFTAHFDQLLLKPGSVLTQSGNFFQVFSQFRKVCYQRLHLSLPACLPYPAAQTPMAIASDEIPLTVSGFAQPDTALQQYWPAGEVEAQHRLQQFAEQQMDGYASQRDLPAVPGTSQLSPYLAAGVLSARQCLHAALRVNRGEFDGGSPGIVCWINELLWREFYKHVLVGYPRVSMHRAFRLETEALRWRDAPEDLIAWQQGRTGIPLIDAAMRQLLATGWMHNRLRMVVAMYLTKNLLINWREGERFFMQHLIDGDLAANNGGWQWSASTGTDSVPYFRIFNPLSQSERFDADGQFIRHWLPELSSLNNRELHNPAKLGGLFSPVDYPAQIVDLSDSRARALQAFKSLPKYSQESLHV